MTNEADPECEGIEADKTFVYKLVDRHELNLHIFNPENHKPEDKRSAIVFFFGGGWTNGAPSQFFPHCQYLASRGMVAISAEYRIESKHGTTPFECIKDGKSALRWVRANASMLGIAPERIAAGGGSAGGHVAAAAGTTTAFEESDEDKNVSFKPNALVLFNPVFDNGPEGYGHERAKARWKEFSPMHNISNDTPPTIVFLGREDQLIPVSTAESYKALMEKSGCRCELHLYEGQAHGFFNYNDGKNEHYSLTMHETNKFLVSLGYLNSEPVLTQN